MNLRDRIRGWCARSSFWLLASGTAALLLLLLLVVSSQRHWQQFAAALQRENLDLQLQTLTQQVMADASQLTDRARELAQSDSVANLVSDNTPGTPDHASLVALANGTMDSLLIVSASHAVRVSAKLADGRFADCPPDPELMRLLEPAARTADDRSSGTLHFADGRWMVARPVFGRADPAAIAGWVAASRALSGPAAEQLARAVKGDALLIQPLRAFDSAELPADLLVPAVARTGQGFAVTSHVSRDNSVGYAALRDAGGKTVWVLRVARSSAGGGPGMGFAFAALSMLLAALAAALFMFKRHVRRQKSVDARYKAIIDQANDGIVIVDAETQQVLYTNPAFLERLGYTGLEAQALTLRDIFADGNATAESVLARLREANSQMALNMQHRCKNGNLIDVEVRCNALDVDGRNVRAYVTHDVSLRRKAEQQLIENQHRLDRMAHHDQLTGLPNRHYLSAFLPDAIAAATAASTMLGVVFIDLDRFKHINDTRGHETGDKLLQEVATRLRAVVRDTDVVIRMGGDEFVVVFRHVKSYEEVTQGAGRINEALNKPIVIDRHPLQTTGSVGVSMFPRDGSNMVELLKHSDTAMYQAKDRGRNNVQMFSQIMNRKLKHRVAVEA